MSGQGEGEIKPDQGNNQATLKQPSRNPRRRDFPPSCWTMVYQTRCAGHGSIGAATTVPRRSDQGLFQASPSQSNMAHHDIADPTPGNVSCILPRAET